MKKLLFVAIAFVALFSSCSKSDIDKPNSEKLIGKWKFTTSVTNDYYNGAPHLYTRTGDPNDYVEFKADNKVTISFMGFVETNTYVLQDDTKITVNGQTDEIKTLTNNLLILYRKTLGATSDVFSEETQTFTK
jgi:hypothetical protein